MLTELVVRQFALIEHACLQLEEGTTVFSGETGAGKSILIDALGAAFGARASSDWVRFGAERAEVTAVLETPSVQVAAALAEQGIDTEDTLILRRVINADGRSRAYVNGTPVPLKVLQQIGLACLDLHGQHEHQALMSSGYQRQMVDARVSGEALRAAADAFERFVRETRRLDALLARRAETVRDEAWLREELVRLQALDVAPGLEQRLQEEVEAGRHFAEIQEAAAAALALLDEGEASVRGQLAQADRLLGHVAGYRADLEGSLELLGQMDVLLGELTPALRGVLDEPFDAHVLEQAEERLTALHEAMRRHQADEDGLLARMKDMQERLDQLDTATWDEEAQWQRVTEARQAYRQSAEALSRARRDAAQALCAELRPFLDRLALGGMQVAIEVEAHAGDESGWTARGWDDIRFLAASNPGEPFRPLATIASGGEMSRLVLALKGCGALCSAPDIAVFDEVDAGIGGETAWHVGELLADMGAERQVLVISHLPQVAACAHHQVRISKHREGERTVTTITPVQAEARRDEIARMLGGAGEKSRAHAEQMLARGQR